MLLEATAANRITYFSLNDDNSGKTYRACFGPFVMGSESLFIIIYHSETPSAQQHNTSQLLQISAEMCCIHVYLDNPYLKHKLPPLKQMLMHFHRLLCLCHINKHVITVSLCNSLLKSFESNYVVLYFASQLSLFLNPGKYFSSTNCLEYNY